MTPRDAAPSPPRGRAEDAGRPPRKRRRETVYAPVNPLMLKWAREEAGYTLEDLEKSFPHLREWETPAGEGKRQPRPTVVQTEALAKRYWRPDDVFYLPKPPREFVSPVQFRRDDGRRSRREDLYPDLCFAIRSARIYQIGLEEVFSEGEEERAQKERLSRLRSCVGNDGLVHRERLRERLRVSLERQKSWQDPDRALREWRGALEAAGAHVLQTSLDKRGNADEPLVSGFFLHGGTFPVITINTNDTTQRRRIFTLFHELGHLLFHGESYLDGKGFRESKRSEEVRCNKFAAEFLVPEDDLRKEFKRRVDLDPGERRRRLARLYSVSLQMMAFRMENLGLITSAEREGLDDAAPRFLSSSPDSGKSSGGGPPRAAWLVSSLGRRYVGRVFALLDRGSLDENDALDHLHVIKALRPRHEDLEKIRNALTAGASSEGAAT